MEEIKIRIFGSIYYIYLSIYTHICVYARNISFVVLKFFLCSFFS
jgi:hypothetical protein